MLKNSTEIPFGTFGKKINLFKNFFTTFLFIVIFFTGVFVVKDYGVSSDEYQHRLHGFINLNYVGEKFAPNITKKLRKDKNYVKFDEYGNNYYGGSLYNASIGFLEILFGIQDKKNQFLFKHYINFLIFFLSLISFYKIIQIRFSDWKYSCLGVVMLFLSPRIFANSFYNPNDLIFMCFCIFAIFFSLKFFEKPNFLNAFLFSLFVANAINMRIMAVIIPMISFFIILIYLNINNDLFKKYLKPCLSIFIFLPLLIYILWPYLWDDPVANFINTFLNLSNFDHKGSNFFLGEYISYKDIPWYYVATWIIVTTPIIYLILFSLGCAKIFLSTINITINKINLILMDHFFLMFVLIPIIAVITLNSTLYNGWRHMYFIYPGIIIITLLGVDLLIKNIKNKYFLNFFLIVLMLSLLNISSWMIKNHPHQNVYFNKFAGKKFSSRFELDYWGLTYRENLKFLLNYDTSRRIFLYNSSKMEMFYMLLSLNEKERSRIEIVRSPNNADYWITNYYNDKNNYDESFYDEFIMINDIVVDGNSINTVFKKK